ncbi:hypothetical protein ABT095_34835 [Kitasatospora sp. NPDC002227]|uniref:hypothetical protein n=1 Tax=Kitasatospora sp. NPDC002227 TaxID=3154773 RepID=UPI0033319AB3
MHRTTTHGLASEALTPLDGLLGLVILGLPVAAPFALLVGTAALAARALRAAGRPRALLTPGTLLLAAGTSLAGAATAVVAGWFSSGFLVLRPDKFCQASATGGSRLVTHPVFPVSGRCVSPDFPTGTELVPGWVNPAVLAGLLLAVAAVGGALGRRRTRRRDARPTSEDSPERHRIVERIS